MGPRKYVKGEVCNIPMKEKRTILGVFTTEQKRGESSNHYIVGRHEPNTIRENYANKNSPAITISHILQVLALPQNTTACINAAIYRFLWTQNYKKRALENVKRSELSLDVEEGGLKIINIENQPLFHFLFLTKWAAKLTKDNDSYRAH